MNRHNAPAFNSKSYPYELMKEQQHALEHLHADFRWGPYGIRVNRFHHATFPPGKIDRFHKHSEEFEFHFIPRGRGMVILKDMPYALNEGMMYLTAPQVMHYQEADPLVGMNELCLRIEIVRLDGTEPADQSNLLAETTPSVQTSWGADSEWREAEFCIGQLRLIPLRPELDRFRAMECFLTAYRAWYESQPGLLTIIKQSIIQILLRMTRTYFPETQQQAQTMLRDMNHYRYKLAEQFLIDNYQESISLETLAERIQISPRQLQRIFKSQSGTTFSEYIEQLRLSHICKELERGDRTIEHLAITNGFSSANYLHRVFKRKYGITPVQYREQFQTHNRQPEESLTP